MRALPHLNHLRSFQIIGKYLNLARAAHEVHLTASALSHQLNVLENQLGVKLFTRTGRGLSFTKAGKDLHVEVDACLTQLAEAIHSVTQDGKEDVLVVNAPPTFAMRWLLPRFSSFKDYTRVEIRISTLAIDFERDNVDCAIYYGHEGGPELSSDFLREESLIVACSPSLITERTPLAAPADLAQHQLLHARIRPGAKFRQDAWTAWSQSIVEPGPEDLRGLVLESRNLLIQAAESGLGVAVIDPMMIKSELQSGKLVQALPHVGKSGCSYYLVYPSTPKLPGKVAAFREWLTQEMHKDAGI